MARLGAMMAGSNPERVRQDNDFYPTPPDVTEALLDNWPLPPRSTVWEPACGDGAISKVLEARGHKVRSSDLHDHGYGQMKGVDFLSADNNFILPLRDVRYIITNPPFKLAAEFIEHAASMKLEGFAMLLKSQFWHARKRLDLFRRHRPTLVLPLTWRPDFLEQGGPTMDVMWCVWMSDKWPTIYRPITRPGAPNIKLKRLYKQGREARGLIDAVASKELETA